MYCFKKYIYRMYSKDLKEKAINLYYKFKSFRQVEHLLKIGKSTLHRWVNNITFSKPVKLNELYTNHYFLTDNVSFHKSKKISDLMQNSYNDLLYIPPYSPEFNPIE